ncbi:murein transglycosylase [Duganella sp. Leaf126]|uniref:lytic murein transglycosylase B n=1 Tax=Duganella sp. Leaf126 TaxID=1736266 RepID=UPI000701462B|nr:lytic murein transglycosylase B [Duganella sp. Leaf126]KQQ46389.1 murein transglycosylase [Duganella sp. Leaf126]
MPIKHLITPLLASLLLTCAAGAHAQSQSQAVDRYGYKPPPQKKAATKKKEEAKPAPAPKAGTDYVGEYVNFGEWKEVQTFLDGVASRNNFDRKELDAVMAQVRYLDSVVQLVKPAPPGKPKNWQAYRALNVDPVRISAGVRFWNENADALARAESLYGVPAEIIVAIVGVETVYGRITGRFRVLDTLATLAFAYPESPSRAARMDYFKSELEAALLFARADGLDPLSMRGSYAGAMGMPQFMPSSAMKYAVDFDGSGKIDLLGSSADVVGSVASFLAAHGWQRNVTGPIAYPVKVSPNRAWEPLLQQGLTAKYTPQDLTAAGVVPTVALPEQNRYGLVDLQNGGDATEYWAANANFFAITQYNRSYFYAMSVVDLGQAIKSARASATVTPAASAASGNTGP